MENSTMPHLRDDEQILRIKPSVKHANLSFCKLMLPFYGIIILALYFIFIKSFGGFLFFSGAVVITIPMAFMANLSGIRKAEYIIITNHSLHTRTPLEKGLDWVDDVPLPLHRSEIKNYAKLRSKNPKFATIVIKTKKPGTQRKKTLWLQSVANPLEICDRLTGTDAENM